MPELDAGYDAPKRKPIPFGGETERKIAVAPYSTANKTGALPMATGADAIPANNPYNTGPIGRAPVASGGGGIAGGFTGGGGGGGFPQPEPQSRPVLSESDWLAGDVDYQNQLKEYDDTLKDFLARLATQESDFKTDYETAKVGFNRNRDRGLLSLGEDYTSRGLANSGLFANAQNEQQAAYKDQETGLDRANTRGLADFANQRRDKERSTEQAKGNAKLSSLGRMSQNQMF
jgi:hypothetical protein